MDDGTASVINGMVNPNIKMNGKTVFITGGNTGLGFESAKDLARRGAKVIIACRNDEKACKAKQDILSEIPDAKVETANLDLGSIESIHECSKRILDNEERLDVLMNNAGIMATPQWKTKDGFEAQFGVNHLGHFLLTDNLLPLLKKSSPSRIVCVSSGAHTRGVMNWEDLMHQKNYNPFTAYQQSKLANVLFAKELCRRLVNTGITVYSLTPGPVQTDLWNNMADGYKNHNFMVRGFLSSAYWVGQFFFLTPKQGAQTQIHCSVAPELSNVSGKYYAKCKVKQTAPAAQSGESAKRLWEVSEKLVGIQTAQESE